VQVAQPSTPAIEIVLRTSGYLQIGADASPALVQTVLTTLQPGCRRFQSRVLPRA
jgi:hypothetical protein